MLSVGNQVFGDANRPKLLNTGVLVKLFQREHLSGRLDQGEGTVNATGVPVDLVPAVLAFFDSSSNRGMIQTKLHHDGRSDGDRHWRFAIEGLRGPPGDVDIYSRLL